MAEVTFKLNGAEELDKILSELPDDIAKKVGEASLRNAAKIILEEAKMLVPKDKGRLAKSLAIKKIKSAFPYLKIYAKRGKGLGGWYAHLVEYGTKPHEIKNVLIGNKFYPVVHHPGTVPNPFLRPALSGKKEEAVKTVGENLMKHIRRVFEKEMKK